MVMNAGNPGTPVTPSNTYPTGTPNVPNRSADGMPLGCNNPTGDGMPLSGPNRHPAMSSSPAAQGATHSSDAAAQAAFRAGSSVTDTPVRPDFTSAPMQGDDSDLAGGMETSQMDAEDGAPNP